MCWTANRRYRRAGCGGRSSCSQQGRGHATAALPRSGVAADCTRWGCQPRGQTRRSCCAGGESAAGPPPSLLRSVGHTRAGSVPRRGIWLTVARAPRRPPAALPTRGASVADGSALAIGVAGKVLGRVTLASAGACSSIALVRQTARPRSYAATTARAGADLGGIWSAGHKGLVRPAGACGHHTGRPRL